MKWTCPVCGYVFEGDAPPEECPSCKAPGSSFKAATDDHRSPGLPSMSSASPKTSIPGSSKACA